MKTVFITGATSGIGEACAEKFAQNNYNLILLARREEKLIQLKNDLEKKYSISIKIICADVRNYSDLEKKLTQLTDTKIDILINNAGLSLGLGPIHEGDISQWDTMIDTNVKGLLYVTRLISPIMLKQNSGHIINISSIAGRETYANGNVYCATKHAVDSISKAIRIDMLPYGIKVTNIAPGMVNTNFSLVRFNGDKNRADSVYKGIEPLYAIDIAESVYFAGAQADNVNLNDIVITPKFQANATTSIRKE
ncbi:MAG: SDR family NAD(P)-dependent oxidoreductase [Bacteroidota bacterium]